MNRCKLNGEFEYIKYDGTNKLDIFNLLSKYKYTRLEIPGHADWIPFTKNFNTETRTIESDIEIIVPGDYLVLLDNTTLAHYDAAVFTGTFYDPDEINAE